MDRAERAAEQGIQIIGIDNRSGKAVIIGETTLAEFVESPSLSVRGDHNAVLSGAKRLCAINCETALDFFTRPICMPTQPPESMQQILHIYSCGQEGGMYSLVVRGRDGKEVRMYDINDLGRCLRRRGEVEPLLRKMVSADAKLVLRVSEDGSVNPVLLAELAECQICCNERVKCVLGCCGYIIGGQCITNLERCPVCQAEPLNILYIA